MPNSSIMTTLVRAVSSAISRLSFTLVAQDWRQLSEAASKERDPEKLMELVAQLNEALKRREDLLRTRKLQAQTAN